MILTQLMNPQDQSDSLNFIFHSMCSKGYEKVCTHPDTKALVFF